MVSLKDCTATPVQVIVSSLSSDVSLGLTNDQVRALSAKHGPNKLEEDEKEHVVLRYIEKFKDPLILLLLGSALLSVVVGEYDDALSILVAVVIVATVGFYQESASEDTLRALKELVPPVCHVVRNGTLQDVLAEELVPGDLVKLSTGDRVPADLRVVQCSSLTVDESSMTGETEPREKTIDPLPDVDFADLTQCANVLFMGTLVCSGYGLGIVIQTGVNTEFGKTFSEMKEIDTKRSPLQAKMDELGKLLSIISLGIIICIGMLGVIQGKSLLSMFNIGVSLAVAAIPEGLPICVTVTLALGVMRMAKKKAIVKRLPAVEALGCADVICTDKTGTLTQNCMSVRSMHCPGLVDFVVVDYSIPKSPNLFYLEKAIHKDHYLCVERLMESMSMCNNAFLSEKGVFLGQPTEIALMDVSCALFGRDLRNDFHRIREVPFSSETKFMEVVYKDGNVSGAHYIKGAIEVVLPQCVTFLSADAQLQLMTPAVIEKVQHYAMKMASDGLRVLAFAKGSVHNQLTFCGIVGLRDPLREGVKESVNRIIDTGARVIMITGDSEHTAVSIGRQSGLFDPATHRTMSGTQIDDVLSVGGEDALAVALNDVTVCFRTSPRHKLSIVRALQAQGHVVAMTGDGVNDASALKAADIGVAMGSGTDVAKEASAMVLLDDSFSTIVAAIEEGKSIFFNIKNFVTFQLSTSIAALSLVALNNIVGRPNPLNPMQILWINIIMDGPLAQSLGVEFVDPSVMKRPPRKRSDDVISREVLGRVFTSGILIMMGTMYIFVKEMEDGAISSRDLTMTFTTFVMFDMFNALTCRHNARSLFEIDFFSNKAFLLALIFSVGGQFLVIYFPPLQRVFRTVSLSFHDILLILAFASSIVALDWIRKKLFPRYFVEPTQASKKPVKKKKSVGPEAFMV